MTKYKILKENNERFSIYRRTLFWWSYVVIKPSFKEAKRFLYEHGVRTFLYEE